MRWAALPFVALTVAATGAASTARLTADSADWSAGGGLITFWQNDDRLWLTNSAGTWRRPIASNHGENGGASLSPTGRVIADVNIGANGRGGLLVLRLLSGGVVRRLRFGKVRPDAFLDPVWAPDQRAVAFEGDTDRTRIYVWNLRNRVRSVSRIRTGGDDSPEWSPDSRRIAFRTCRHDSCQIATMAADGSRRKTLVRQTRETPYIDLGSAPTWAPDGRSIAFASPEDVSANDKVRWKIYVVRPDGRGLRRIAEIPLSYHAAFAWSPDSRQIALSTNGTGISVVDVKTRRRRRVTSLGGASTVAWTPSAWILFTERGIVYKVLPTGSPIRVTR